MIFMMGVSTQANEMMRVVALLLCSIAVHVHGQSTGVLSASSPEPTPTFSSSLVAANPTSTLVFPSSTSSSSLSAVVSTSASVASSSTDVSAKISSVGTTSSMAGSDAQPSVTSSTTASIASTSAAASSSSVDVPATSTTLTDSMSTQDSVTTTSTMPSLPSFTSSSITTESSSSEIPPTPSSSNQGLSPTELQLAIAVPASAFGYTSLLLLLLIIVFACRRWRRRKQKDQVDDYTAMYSATVLDNKDADDQTETAFKPKPMRVTYRPKIPVMSHPLTVAELGALMQNEDAIANEFANIPSNMVTMDDIPPGAEAKNRYRNVLPNPHTRVPLFLKFGVANSDYINANYIRGFTGVPRAFISTQGPLWETTPDFWRMVWEQRSSIIVMLTELEENNMVKCHRYWPDEQEGRTAVYDDVEVTLAKRVMEKHYTTTTFLLRHLEKGVTREVIHFWFRAWPDHGAPDYAEPFLNFIQTFRSATADLPVGPVVVHCSAGIGRSGVFIATCMGLLSLEDSGEVDILKLVSTMRQDRGGMVQSRTQYIFLHKALYQYGLWQERAKAPSTSFVLNDAPSGDGSQVNLLD